MSPMHPGNIRLIPVLVGSLLMFCALFLKAADEQPDYSDPSYYQEAGNPCRDRRGGGGPGGNSEGNMEDSYTDTYEGT